MNQATTTIQRKVTGKVVSAGKMQKTIVVLAEHKEPHPIYGKFIRKRTKYYVHDEENKAKEGQIVNIVFSRPLSKKKRWQLVEIVGAR
jgi:small subunit ribosomal protein S17